MKSRALALLVSLLAVGVRAAAPVEIRAVNAGLSAPAAVSAAAPASLSAAPSLLSAPALSAAPIAAPLLAPAFMFPAALPAAAVPVAAPIAAAPAPAASLKPAFAAASALPAAASSERPSAPSAGEAAAKTANDDLFDGSSARRAAADGPAVPSAPSAHAAPVPTDSEIASLYLAARPGSQAVATLQKQGGFAAAATELITQYSFVNDALLHSLHSSPAMFSSDGRAVIKAAEELISVADARQDPAARRFLQALGRRRAYEYHRQAPQAAKFQALMARARGDAQEKRRHMPRNDLGSGDYWDMAAGMNAGGFILSELEPGTRYKFLDLSPFVVSYLNELAFLKGADAAAEEADILKLTRPAKPLSVLRTKNAVAYVPGFEKKLSEMADWIAPGGRLVIQNDPMAGQRGLIVKKHGPLALRLLEEGWNFTFEFQSSRTAEHTLDTLIFTRPRTSGQGRSAAEARELWTRYLAAVKYADARDGF